MAKFRTLALAIGLIAAISLTCARASTFPDRPIHIIVPYSAGGNGDMLVRAVARHVAEQLGQAVIVENKPGSASILGTDIVARSAPDGYTLLMVGTAYTTNPFLFRTLPYDSERDLTGVTLIATAPLLLLASSESSIKSTRQLIALAEAKPGQISFASAGIGGGSHLAAELFQFDTGIRLLHVPYKGSAPALTDLIGGHVSIMFETIIAGLPHVRGASPRVRALAVTSDKRSPMLPDVPTLSESGVPGYESNSWYGLLVPGKTPSKIVSLLNAAFVKALKQPDIIKLVRSQGGTIGATSATEFNEFMAKERRKWAAVIKAAGIKAE